MNWFVFTICAWVLLGLETGLRDTLRLGPTAIAPSFVIPLAVFIALSAPARPALWACLILGALLDLTWHVAADPGRELATIVGPYALGLALAGQFVLTIRGLTIRRNPLTMVFLSVFASAVAHLVVVAMYSARNLFGDPIVWNATRELLERMGSSLYTGVTAFVLGVALMPLSGMFGMPAAHARRPGR